jgi:hypothetical protein
MTEAEVIALFATPATLLRRVHIQIGGGGATRAHALDTTRPAPPANGPAAVATFKVTIRGETAKGFTTGISGFFRRRKDRPSVRIDKQGGAAKANGALAADELNAYYVPMVQTDDVTLGTSHYTLPTGGGPDLMLTSKLSGCRFGVGSTATGALLVSHVQPDLRLTGGARALDLSTSHTGGFHALDDAIGKGSGYTEFAAVIGVRTGTAWTFYSQASSYNNGYTVDSTRTIG